MMISGSANTAGPGVPSGLQPHITLRSCCKLADEEIRSFQRAFSALDRYASHFPLSPEAFCVVLFTDQREIRLTEDRDTLGQSFPLVVLWLGSIRSRSNYSPELLQLIMVEELIHSLYQVQNEYRVKEMTVEALSPYFQTLTLHDAYPLLFDSSDHRIPLPEYPAAWATRP